MLFAYFERRRKKELQMNQSIKLNCRSQYLGIVILLIDIYYEYLPNAVKISPPCCLVKLTTRTIDESADWDVGGNTKDVGIGPAKHSIGIIIRRVNSQFPLKSLCRFSMVNSRITIIEARVLIWFLIRDVFRMFVSAADAGTFVAWMIEAIFFMSKQIETDGFSYKNKLILELINTIWLLLVNVVTSLIVQINSILLCRRHTDLQVKRQN